MLPPVGQCNSSELPVDLSSYISLQDLTNSALRGNKTRNQQVQQLETPQRPVKSLCFFHIKRYFCLRVSGLNDGFLARGPMFISSTFRAEGHVLGCSIVPLC